MHDEFWNAWADLERAVPPTLHVEPPIAGACDSWDTIVGVNTAMDCVSYTDAGPLAAEYFRKAPESRAHAARRPARGRPA